MKARDWIGRRTGARHASKLLQSLVFCLLDSLIPATYGAPAFAWFALISVVSRA
jgi:hypothetical protein